MLAGQFPKTLEKAWQRRGATVKRSTITAAISGRFGNDTARCFQIIIRGDQDFITKALVIPAESD